MPADAQPGGDWRAGLRKLGLECGRPLKSSVDIDVACEEVWRAIAEPGNLRRIHPFCAATEVERWPGAGSRDSITYYSGIRYRRNFVRWQEGVGYDIELGDPPNQTARVHWRIEPTSPSGCRMSIEVFPLLRSDQSDEKKRAYQDRLFGEVLKHYLDCVVNGVKYFATTGNPVSKDQFGRNPLYSDQGAGIGETSRLDEGVRGGRVRARRRRRGGGPG